MLICELTFLRKTHLLEITLRKRLCVVQEYYHHIPCVCVWLKATYQKRQSEGFRKPLLCILS